MPNNITPDDIISLQKRLGMNDTEIAKALNITRQTWRNWKTNRTIPYHVGHLIRALDALTTLDPANENLPEGIRQKRQG